GGDDRLTELEGSEDDGSGEGGAADEFGHDIHLRIMDDRLPVGGHTGGRDFVWAGFIEGLDSDFAHIDYDADARSHEAAVELERVENAATHRAAANHAEVDLLHVKGAELDGNL